MIGKFLHLLNAIFRQALQHFAAGDNQIGRVWKVQVARSRRECVAHVRAGALVYILATKPRSGGGLDRGQLVHQNR
jgi:hypothetical protein